MLEVMNPQLIQGGMGAAISDYKLARSVGKAGEKLDIPVLGMVSGTGLTIMAAVRLQNGSKDMVDALTAFDEASGTQTGSQIIDRYYSDSPKSPTGRYILPAKPEILVTGQNEKVKDNLTKLAIASAFAEVWLAKQGHNGPIGINVLEKIQLLQLTTILGAMWAGVDWVCVGAGIPIQFPKMLEDFANNRPASYKIDVAGDRSGHVMTLDPSLFTGKLAKPKFAPIVSSNTLATYLAKNGGVDALIVENSLAGGHNAPPRGKLTFDEKGQPIYGDKDNVDLNKLSELGLPYYLAGGSAAKLQEIRGLGAAGIQVGSPFALSDESGLSHHLKVILRQQIAEGKLDVLTSVDASPSGFPFQIKQLLGTLSEQSVYEGRKRICNLGQLVQAYLNAMGEIGFRCSAEPVNIYTSKGGDIDNTVGSVCLCNGLIATAGYPLSTEDGQEPPIVTLGKNLEFVRKLVAQKPDRSYSAEDVVRLIYARND